MYDNIPGEEYISKAVMRLWMHCNRGPSGMKAEYLRMWDWWRSERKILTWGTVRRLLQSYRRPSGEENSRQHAPGRRWLLSPREEAPTSRVLVWWRSCVRQYLASSAAGCRLPYVLNDFFCGERNEDHHPRVKTALASHLHELDGPVYHIPQRVKGI